MRAVRQNVLLTVALQLTQVLVAVSSFDISSAWWSHAYPTSDLQGYLAANKRGDRCYFEPVADNIAMAGDVFDFAGVYNLTECQDVCRHQSRFYCAAVMLRSQACYLTGFRVRGDFWSTHYSRLCDEGPECFAVTGGWSTSHTRPYPLPWPVVLAARRTQVLYCMALCLQSANCVGFDFKDNNRKCYLSELFTMEENPDFRVYLRRC